MNTNTTRDHINTSRNHHHHHRHHHHTSSAASSSSTSIPASSSTTATSEGSAMLLQHVLHEKEHKICTRENKSLILSEGLTNLRVLTKEIQEDDWKYSNNNVYSNTDF